MEYMKGRSLAEELRNKHKIHVLRALAIIIQLLEALDEAHSKRIVHRDLKPENVFLAYVKGRGEVVKVLDFGISKILKPGEEITRLTKTGAMVGTPYYMSPEQVRGRGEIDHRSDIYSCGVILYEMLTGRVPFGGSSLNAVIFSIAEDPFPEPTEKDGIPEILVDLMRRAMARRYEDRIQTAAEFKRQAAEVLYALKSGKNVVTATTPMVVEMEAPAPQKKSGRGIFIASILGALALAVLVIVSAFWLATRGNAKARSDAVPSAAQQAVTPTKQAPVPQPATKKKTLLSKASPTVKIKLVGLPKKAVVTYAGQEVDGNVIEVVRGEEPVKILVSARGHMTKEFKIVPDGERIIDASLQRVTRGGKDEEDGEKKGKKDEASDEPATKKKKKKMTLDWSYP
jgi:hypothetical protein